MGQEFRVNTYQTNWQFNPDIVTFADGSFLVTWDSYFDNYEDGGPELTYVAGQRYDASGRRVGTETLIDAVNGCVSEAPSVTELKDGGYVVTHVFDNYDPIFTDRQKIYATVYNADGSERKASFRVDTVSAVDALSPEVVALGNGGFRISFDVSRSSIQSDDIYARNYDRMGRATGVDTLANPNQRRFDQGPPESTMLQNGGTITIWRSEASFELGTDLDANEIRGTLTDANGRVVRSDFSLGQAQGTITEAPFGNSMGKAYNLTGLSQGGFVISHVMNAEDVGGANGNFDDTVVLRFFNNAGNLTARDRAIHTTDEIVFGTSIAQLDTGEIIVVWEQYAENDAGTDIKGRLVSSTGRALSGVFEIGADRFEGDDQADPVVRALAGGGFVVAYESDSIDNEKEGIAARIYGRGTMRDDRLSTDATRMMAGLDGDDTISGSAAGNMIYGNKGADALYGFGGADAIYGGTSTDRLSGGAAADRLIGGTGNDTLTGGTGADWFVFDTAATATNRDRITDFNSNDRLILDNAAFAGIGAAGNLNSARFDVLGGAATTTSDRILYDRASGTLYYDSNGSSAGGRVAIVVLEDRPFLSADDFRII
jgi:Ca2+-binding RTX toxin-like protein